MADKQTIIMASEDPNYVRSCLERLLPPVLYDYEAVVCSTPEQFDEAMDKHGKPPWLYFTIPIDCFVYVMDVYGRAATLEEVKEYLK